MGIKFLRKFLTEKL